MTLRACLVKVGLVDFARSRVCGDRSESSLANEPRGSCLQKQPSDCHTFPQEADPRSSGANPVTYQTGSKLLVPDLLGEHSQGLRRSGERLPRFFGLPTPLVKLGSRFAVNDVMGVRFSGFSAALFWRAVYLAKLESPQNRARVAADWILGLLFRPAATEIRDLT